MSQPPIDYFHQAYEPISRSQSESPSPIAPQDSRLSLGYSIGCVENMPNANEYLSSANTLTTTSVSQHDMQNTHDLSSDQDQKPIISSLTSVSLLPGEGEGPIDGSQLLGLIDQASASGLGIASHPSTMSQLQAIPVSGMSHSLAKPLPLRGDQSQMQMSQALLHLNESYVHSGVVSVPSQQVIQGEPVDVNIVGHPAALSSETSMEENRSGLPEASGIASSQGSSLQSTMPASVIKVLSGSSQQRPRSEKKPIPDELKDSKYYERRKRNNVAAKKSRDSRKAREDEIAIRASFLEKENAILRAQVATLRDEANSLRQLLLSKRNGRT